jgi:hypothetical protein
MAGNGHKWRFSKAKQLIAQDMIDGLVPTDEPIVNVEKLFNDFYRDHEYFAEFPFDKTLYKGRFERLQVVVKRLGRLAKYDHDALVHDRQLYPFPTHGPTGKPLWHGSTADRWLDVDIANGVHLQPGMTPMKLWATRPEYAPFKASIRQRIDQKKQAAKDWGRKTPGQIKSSGRVDGRKRESRSTIMDPYVNDEGEE